MPLDLSGLSLAAVIGLFAAAAASVWIAGTRLTGFLNAIADLTGLGKAFTGMLFLGGITSLPEVAAVSTSAAIGNAPLALNNLIGTSSVNLVLLAVADIIYGRGALTAVAAKPATLMQGVLSMFLSASVAIFAAAGDVSLGLFGAGSMALVIAAVAALWTASRFEQRHVWEVVKEDQPNAAAAAANDEPSPYSDWPLRKLVTASAIGGAVILVSGVALATAADEVSTRTGIGSAMIGFVFVAMSTALPEISSVTAAIRIRQYDMAVGDIFGTNLFNLGLIFLADLIYRGEPVLEIAGTFEVVGALLAVLMTGIFLVGLLRRGSGSIFRMGYDSLVALVVFGLGLTVLSQAGAG